MTAARNLITDALWAKACLKYKLRPHGQTQLYEWIDTWTKAHPRNAGPLVVNARRRFGKTFVTTLLCLQRAVGYPRQIIRLVAPTREQGLKIVSEAWREVTRDMPPWIEAKIESDEVHIFNTRWKGVNRRVDYSVIAMHGSEMRGGAGMRGMGADLIVMDELGFMKDPRDVIQSVVMWQLHDRPKDGRPGPLMLVISTPPKFPNHYLADRMIPEAIRANRYFEMPMSRDQDATQEDEEFLLSICGSKDSIAWQREAECKLFADPGDLILPEWVRRENKAAISGQNTSTVFSTYPLPEFYYPRTALDLGYHDPTAALFWFYDFEQDRLVVLRELLFRSHNLAEVAELVRKEESAVFGKAKLFGELQRHGDLRTMEWASLRDLFKFDVSVVAPQDKLVHIQALNSDIAAGKVWIHEGCVETLYQLRHGAYKAPGSDVFIRSEKLGHCDALSALIVAHRQVQSLRRRDPKPDFIKVGDVYLPADDETNELKLIEERTYIA